MKIEFNSQKREMLLFLHVIKQYIYSDMHPVYALYSMYFDT